MTDCLSVLVVNFQEVRNYPTVLDDLEDKFKISTDELKELKAMSVKAIKSSEEARVCFCKVLKLSDTHFRDFLGN